LAGAEEWGYYKDGCCDPCRVEGSDVDRALQHCGWGSACLRLPGVEARASNWAFRWFLGSHRRLRSAARTTV